MALPSQTSRAETWRSSPGSSGPSPIVTLISRNKPAFIGGVALAAAVGGWLYFRPSAAPTTAAASPSGDTFLPTEPQAAARPETQKPATISMGMLNEPAASSPASRPLPNASLNDLIAEVGTKGAVQPVTPINGAAQPGPGSLAPAPTAPSPAPRDPLNEPANSPTATPVSPTVGGTDSALLLDQANQLVQQNQPLEARRVLNDALMNPAISTDGRGSIRAKLASINETLFFSPTAYKGDPLTDEHAVTSGETLGRIVRKEGLPIDWRLLVRVNRMPSENALRVGQKLKIVRQPMHAVVHKNSYRMDIYAGPPATPGASAGPDGQDAGWTYIRSFRVGLGESNGTPEGMFIVRANSKLVNPKWVNPRTGEVFMPDDPKNPIGERWIGLEGIDENTRKFAGYGIHGTVDPESIGQQKSMGCVRLAPGDVEMVYEMLVDRLSSVKIMP
ncbi:MAG TPA: L,D-transpeptidase family protein [Phycisphaerales bacterium]|nr:L,D-transpeptidase family protein [Phycisphaerales bacterium]